MNIARLQTKCPFSDCSVVFEVEQQTSDALIVMKGPCPQCQRVASFKPLFVVEKLERSKERTPNIGELPFSPMSAIVEDVRSLWNVGSIFRTADGAGFATLYLCGISGRPPRQEIAKTSLGSEEHIQWAYFVNAIEVIPILKERGIKIVALERNQNSEDLEAAIKANKISKPVCLVVGNEVSGISQETLSMCDMVCHLPMRGIKESLNVAVAFGVASYLLAAGGLSQTS